MEFKWANLSNDQIAFLKRMEEEFAQKFGDKVYVMAMAKNQ